MNRILAFPLIYLIHPLIMMLLLDGFRKPFKHKLCIADDAVVGLYVFVYLCAVGVYMQHLCVRSKSLNITGYTIREPRAHGNQKVTFAYRKRSRFCSVHSYHTRKRLIRCRESTQTHKR